MTDWQARLDRFRQSLAHAPGGSSALLDDGLALARVALQSARADLALPLLDALSMRCPDAAQGWQLLGVALAGEQRMPEAQRALARAAALEPDDPLIARAHAQAMLDIGGAASALFEHLLRLTPESLPAVAGWAAALEADGDFAGAERALSERVHAHPDWLAGHKALADLRWTAGEAAFDESYRLACDARPQDLRVRLAWFGALAQAADWERASRVVSDGDALFGARPALQAARAVIASECGQTALASSLFAQVGSLATRDEGTALAHLRHCLKCGQFEAAEQIALASQASTPLLWPYLSLIWRARRDPRAQWLDGDPPYIGSFDLGLSDAQLQALAAVLRRLHAGRRPYLEQSVRGGTQTQTDRQLFFRAEPEIQQLRAQVHAAVRTYIDAMPAPLAGHPLLGVARERVLFSGSWSVRLQTGGFHTSHTHPRGWISSALYVSVPSAAQRGTAPAGWIRFGSPPASLGMVLPAYGQIEPRAARLVLFPSHLWHQTLPFDDGERLVVAFDVARPPGSVSRSAPPAPS